jgi:hypothetical protein
LDSLFSGEPPARELQKPGGTTGFLIPRDHVGVERDEKEKKTAISGCFTEKGNYIENNFFTLKYD